MQEELIRQRKKNHELTAKLQKSARQANARTKDRKKMERLEQEYRDLWESFERSEAIRKQQKQVIQQLRAELGASKKKKKKRVD